MTRNEMLEKLHSIRPGVELTVLPTEEAIECEYVSNEGYGYKWIGMWEWPAYRINLPSKETLNLIKEKIVSKSLTCNDVSNTELESLYNSQSDETTMEISDFFEPLKTLSLVPNGEMYGLLVSKRVQFFDSYEAFENAFKVHYLSDMDPWDECSTEDLENWITRLECEFDGIAFTSFD